MATRDKLRMRAARAREEMEQTGRLVLRAPAVVRGAECAIRFLMGALLAGAEIFGGYAPFGVGMVAASGSGVDGFCALLGACLGYLSFQGFAQGLRYVAACILVFSVAFAFYDIRPYRRGWFMPLASAAMDGVTGFVYLSDRGWAPESLIFFGTELLLCAASAYFYRVAFSPWKQKGEQASLSLPQAASLLVLAGTLLITLSQITLLGDLSVGRFAAAVGVMAAASTAGMGPGAALGVAAGVGMDLAAGGTPFYSMAYALAGVMAGVFRRQGRLACALAYVLSNALCVLWTWEQGGHISLLYEVFAASVVFLLLPRRALCQVGALVGEQGEQTTRNRARIYVKTRLERTAAAFRELYQSMRGAFAHPENDGDAACVFDRTADRVCRRCPLQSACWQRDYVSTFNALNDALPAMLERGRGEGEDFPPYFSNRCIKFPAFLAAANEELAGLLYRRQYHSRVREGRAAVCRQYEELAGVLGAAAAELGEELTPDPLREKRLRRHLTALGLACRASAFYDQAGRLRLELEGSGLNQLREKGEVERLSALLGVPLRAAEEEEPGRLVLVQREPLKAVAGVAARRKEGEPVSGDTGAWFKDESGGLFVLLCDGMGAGEDARGESTLAVRLLEQLLRAGMAPESALRTLSGALALRNEESRGGFTTVDLLRVDLFTGQAQVWKYGAAPTYIKKGAAVSRLTGAALPAGLVWGEGSAPDTAQVQLEAGDWVVLVSDGVAGGESDVWLREQIAAFAGESPRELTQALLDESARRVSAADDRTALALRLIKQ